MGRKFDDLCENVSVKQTSLLTNASCPPITAAFSSCVSVTEPLVLKRAESGSPGNYLHISSIHVLQLHYLLTHQNDINMLLHIFRIKLK